ncbi:MAG: YfiM family protein [Bacteroidota bacterium]|nr:YfiM family protein [Bacteroidota bacterium]
MKIIFSIFIAAAFTLSCTTSEAQFNYKPTIRLYKLQNFKDTSEPQNYYPYNKKRVRLVTLANVAGYGGALIGLNAIWYAQYPRSGFHFFNDDAEWLQVDKVGHAYSAYSESRASMELWRWAGLSRRQRIWIGGLSGVGYQSIIEILDGFSSEYGFSPGDFAANIFGSGMFMAQEFAWDDQRIKFKFSFHKKYYGEADLDARADKLYGKTEIERFIKDYNAQSYWLSANIHSFFPDSKLPGWLSLAVGYGAENMFGARSNIAVDKTGTVIFDRSDLKRYRQWYISPDVDFTKIRTNKKGLKVLFFVLSAVKFPAPTLEYSNGSFKGHWLVF